MLEGDEKSYIFCSNGYQRIDFSGTKKPGFSRQYFVITHRLITARKLIESGQFANSVQPEIFRTPGYPLLLIPGILLGQQELVAIFIQIMLSCFTIFLIYKIALAIWGESKIATFCALLYAIEPVSILWLTLLMPETLFTALITLFIYLLIKYFTEKSWKYLLCAAITLAASIYVRPIGYYLPFL